MAESETILKTSSSSYRSRRAAECCIPCKCRYVLAAFSCSGFCVIYLLRVNLSVALVAMVNSTYANEKVSTSNPECQRNLSTSSLQKVITKIASILLRWRVSLFNVFSSHWKVSRTFKHRNPRHNEQGDCETQEFPSVSGCLKAGDQKIRLIEL